MTKVVMIGSPLLGPAVWRPTAVALASLDWDVQVIPGPARAPRHPDEVLEHLLGRLPTDEDLAVVAHSNAGLYVPALSTHRRVVASVFADAALPPATGAAGMAPGDRHDALRRMADADGLLPPWTDWWGEDEVAALFPDIATRAAVESEQQRLPLTYFTASLPVPNAWTNRPAAYLAFSDAYDRERDAAAEWGWAVRTLPGGHLHPLVNSAAVAAAIDELMRLQLRLLPRRSA